MWRVLYRLRGADEEWQQHESEADAREFLRGILDADRDGLVMDATLEEWDGDKWIARR